MSRHSDTQVERDRMKRLMLLWLEVLHEMGNQVGTDTTHDSKTAMRRFEHEGLSFLTITLPDFCTDLQKGLDRGWADHDLWKSFSFKGGLPRFLGGFLDLVFDRSSGRLLNDPDIDAIFALRQITLMFGKVGLECQQWRTGRAMKGYIECEQELKAADAERSQADYLDFSRISAMLFSSVFSRVNSRIARGEVLPKHGPGATAEKLTSNKKYVQRTWTTRLEPIFPALDYLIGDWKCFDELDQVEYLEPRDERPVRVITVPKTLKTPRIIAIEPVYMQYIQQAVLECFLEEFERDDILPSFLGFDDQTPNQRMAEEGSRKGNLATLDLSEASDRVSNQHVREMTRPWPDFAEAVQACRSRKADVPGVGEIRLSKFASMGSALCFPFEAMVFLTVVFCGIQKALNRPLSYRDMKSYVGRVRIYGDDIIIPVEFVSCVVGELEAFGFRVNASKSFWTGKFRESCGRDYYNGRDVSVARCRSVLPTHRKHAAEVLSTVSLRNQLYQLGLWKTCQWLDQQLESILRYYPVVAPTSAIVGRHTVLPYVDVDAWHPELHVPLVKGYTIRTILPKDYLDGMGALMKFYLKRGEDPSQIGHLERAGRPVAVNLRLRMAMPY